MEELESRINELETELEKSNNINYELKDALEDIYNRSKQSLR